MLYIIENSRQYSSHSFYFVEGYSVDRDRIDAILKANAADEFPLGLKWVAIADDPTWLGQGDRKMMSVDEFVQVAFDNSNIWWDAEDWDSVQAKVGAETMALLGISHP